ncbi:MAG: GrdX family protein [Firmicutes bacterium]|nr:GrdX family protein [Bacillota bacterium]
MEDILITNNINVKESYYEKINVVMVESLMLMDVLIEVRNHVHRNYKILTHPLSGSVKPNETPYKSVLLRRGSGLDFESLSMIENAISVTEKLYLSKEPKKWDENILLDFRVIDYNLISSGIESMVIKKI